MGHGKWHDTCSVMVTNAVAIAPLGEASIHPPVSGAPLDAAYAIGSCLSDAKHAPGLKNGSLLQRGTATFHARNIDPR